MGLGGTLRVLIIDHYDSYTNNLLQLLQGTRETDDGTRHSEWSSAVVRFDQYTWEHFRDYVLPSVDAIILSPGPGRPDRTSDFGFNSRLIKEANIPILGVCLGHQGIGTSFGANIIHAPNIKHGQASQIIHTNSGVLKNLPQRFDAIRYNSLVLDFEGLHPELEVNAWTYDPEDPSKKVLMGLQHQHRPIFGVQWHPESICSSYGNQILSNFREIVLDFWNVSTPWNRWTKRPIGRNVSLPSQLVDDSVIEREVAESAESGFIPSTGLNDSRPRPYFVKSVPLGRGPSAQDAFELFVQHSTLDGEAWLDSAKVRDVHSRNSYLAAGSFSLSYSTRTRSLSFYQENKRIKTEKLSESYWTWLDRFQKEVIQTNTQALSAHALDQEAEIGQPIFQVGLIGYLGYELKRESLPGYTYTPSAEHLADTQHNDTRLLFADTVLWLDNYTRNWTVVGLVRRDESDPIGAAIGSTRGIGRTESNFDAYVERIREGFARPPSPPHRSPTPLPVFHGIDNETTYSAAVEASRAAIREGESYELTLTTKFKADCADEDPYSLYLYLRSRNPAPYSAYLNFPYHDVAILSSSPERFISIDRDGVAEMKPIKGTIGVSTDAVEDKRRVNLLATDKKELAENLMIVDLIRSDLHNMSPSKSITVPKLLQVESYETVHQLVTTIQSQIAPKVGSVKAIERCFPPGSMTGAPKLRSVQLLDAFEGHQERGPYAGSLGYLCASGTVDQSVIIRTIVKTGNELVLGAGGAITWLSDARKEWEEVMVKANAVANAEPLVQIPEIVVPELVA
ncbi:ADC synthase [Lepidopterella palustris CBS 459.81]|uniref:aminodeoxychorismate synthase n=1 Tax=Lepidopterella palustris CBS 459.81 TaxID=1314670 RepID=A0A8E2JEZ2_9PEZI|nr:ADC synthase [Lepidopterella palustris CBS 459.81]